MAESRQRWQVLRRWRGQSPQRLAVLAVLGVFAVLAGVVWWWGVGGLAVAAGIVLIGGLIVWAVVMPGRLARHCAGPTWPGCAAKTGWRR